jgi:nucleotide-binding universal stress UspA family protein
MAKKENPNIILTTTVIVTGESIYGEIIQYVEKEGIDLIVIGTRGRSGIKNYY